MHDETKVMPLPLAVDREGAGRHRERDHDNGRDQRVVGFGDHLPAFLRRPVRVAGA